MSRTFLLLLALLSAGAAAEPLTNQDVVQLVFGGASTRQVLDAIAAREPAFDLDPEILEEMRIAGVPEVVIRAMRERARAPEEPEEPAEPASPPEAAAEESGLLTLALRAPDTAETDGDGLLLPSLLLDRNLLEAHAFEGEPWIDDVAVFLACGNAVHVPDQWRNVSTLGRDFVRMPRHRLLAFHRGAEPLRAEERVSRLRKLLGRRALRRNGVEIPDDRTWFVELPMPDALSARPSEEFDERHTLLLGVAVRVQERWIVVSEIATREWRPDVHGDRVAARVGATLSLAGVQLNVSFVD
jgi:hypothetical protein